MERTLLLSAKPRSWGFIPLEIVGAALSSGPRLGSDQSTAAFPFPADSTRSCWAWLGGISHTHNILCRGGLSEGKVSLSLDNGQSRRISAGYDPRVTPFAKAGPTLAGFLPSSGFCSGLPTKCPNMACSTRGRATVTKSWPLHERVRK